MSRYVCCCVSLRKEKTEQQSLTAHGDGRGDTKKDHAVLSDTPFQSSYINQSSPATHSLSETTTPSSVTSINHDLCSEDPHCSPDLNLKNQSGPATHSLSETTTPSSVTSINHDLCSEDPHYSPDLNLKILDTSEIDKHASSTTLSAVGGEKTESSSQEEIDMSNTVSSALDFDTEIVPSAATTSGIGEDCDEGDDTCDGITYKSQYNEEAHRMNPLQSSLRTISKSEAEKTQHEIDQSQHLSKLGSAFVPANKILDNKRRSRTPTETS